MPGIGRMEYPEISYSNALETIESIKTKNIKTIHGLAEELGYSTRAKSPGGTFYYKLVALDKLYGLIERGKGDLSLSPLGQRIAFPLNASDRVAAIRESILHVELLRSLFQSLGGAYHDSDFRPKLREITGAAPDQIDREATRIENLYVDAVQYLRDGAVEPSVEVEAGARAGPEPGKPVSHLVARSPEASQREPAIPTVAGPVRNLHSEDGYFIRVRLEVAAIEEAIAVLTALRNRVAHLPQGTGSTAEGTPGTVSA